MNDSFANDKNAAFTHSISHKFNRLPEHIGIIPDGNRRWAQHNNLGKERGYAAGIEPGFHLFKLCQQIGIKELTYYGFTTDNAKRPTAQTKAFTDACIKAVSILSAENASLLIVGNTASKLFPQELLPYTTRTDFGSGGIKINFLVNYGWEWDLNNLRKESTGKSDIQSALKSAEISRLNLIIRWGGRRRLSGFLPVQSIYADFYVADTLWPDFMPQHLYDALAWYQQQDVTLGG